MIFSLNKHYKLAKNFKFWICSLYQIMSNSILLNFKEIDKWINITIINQMFK